MKGIMFTEPLFHKVVKGEKTQTRRLIKPQPDDSGLWNDGLYPRALDSTLTGFNGTVDETGESKEFRPKYKVGEIVYLKEPYVLYDEQYQELRTNASGIQFAYRYGNNIPIAEITGKSDSKWKNKLFMPESAARYFIKITAVRAERLQDISEHDCFEEGINDCDFGGMACVTYGISKGLFFEELGSTPQKAYAALINKINGKGIWESNPWVWVYDFVKTEKQ